MTVFDFFVIGGGSGGVAAARRAAGHGAKVAIAEPNRLGGTCVNRGCVPKKLMRLGADFALDFETAKGFGWNFETDPEHDFRRFLDVRNREIERLNGVYVALLHSAGVEIFKERAVITGKQDDLFNVEVGRRHHQAWNVLVATGGEPAHPDAIEGIDLAATSDYVYEEVYDLPGHVVVIGGGYIGLESGAIFRAFGSEVTVVMRFDMPLRGFDHDVRTELCEQLEGYDFTFKQHSPAILIERDGGGYKVHLKTGEVLDADLVVNTTGRTVRPNTTGIGLEDLRVTMAEGGAIAVDNAYRTNVDGLYAVGDCSNHAGEGLNPSQHDLTPAAIAEGRAVAEALFNDNHQPVAYASIPTAVFCAPQVGTAGLSEDRARDLGHDVKVYKTRFRPMLHTLSGQERKTFMKLVVDAASDRVLGCCMVGDDAAEIVQGLAVAITAGATKADFDATIGVHPTAAEEFVTMFKPA